MAPPATLISTREALDILRLTSPSSIVYLVNTGVLTPAYKTNGLRGAYVFDRSHVEKVAKARDAQ